MMNKLEKITRVNPVLFIFKRCLTDYLIEERDDSMLKIESSSYF